MFYLDIDIGTKHRLIAFKPPLNFNIFILLLYGHTGSQLQY